MFSLQLTLDILNVHNQVRHIGGTVWVSTQISCDKTQVKENEVELLTWKIPNRQIFLLQRLSVGIVRSNNTILDWGFWGFTKVIEERIRIVFGSLHQRSCVKLFLAGMLWAVANLECAPLWAMGGTILLGDIASVANIRRLFSPRINAAELFKC